MRYEPVKLRNIIRVKYRKATAKDRVAKTDDVRTSATGSRYGMLVPVGSEEFFRVTCKLLGDCGHEHRTRETAQRCLRRMKAQFTAVRSEQSKLAYQRRRDAALAGKLNTLLPSEVTKRKSLLPIEPIKRRSLV